MVPSVAKENIPSDTTGDRSQDPPTSSLNHYAPPGPSPNIELVYTESPTLRLTGDMNRLLFYIYLIYINLY
jgi:hypothetical protein